MKTETIIGGIEQIGLAGQIIREGGLVAFPTETVYGLGADAFNEEAVRAIFTAKGRPQDNPLIVHIACAEDATKVAAEVPETALRLFEKFSPGPLTVVMKKRPELPDATTAGLQTVGIRIPNHPLALALIRESGRAIAAPSANSSGRVSPTEALHVYEDMNGKIPLILDGGKTSVGIESTVLDITKPVPVILRPGAVTADMLAEVLGKVVNHKGEVIVAEAPGMKYRHYAPVCPCDAAKTAEAACALYDASDAANKVIIGGQSFMKACGDRKIMDIGATPEECTSNLFSALRKAEKENDYIVIQYFTEEGGYASLNNRITKAAGGKIV